jgi:hypothetical protein
VKLAFESEMSGSGGWGPVAGKASALFRLEASRAASQDRLSVQVFATGGAGFGALADTIKSQMVSPTGIDQATASLGNFLAQFKQENAATTYYRVSSMEDFGWDPAGIDIWSDRQETKLRVLVNEYRTTLFYLTNIKGVLDGSHPLASVMRKEDIEDLRKYVRPAEEYLDSIAINHHQCKQSHSPNDPACDLPPNRINLKGLLFLEGLDPPRANIYLHGLSPEQTKVVLSAPPSIRLTYAKRYNSAIDGFVAFFQTIGHYELSLAVVYAGTDGKEEGIYLDGPWHSGYNTVWWGTGPMQGVQFWEDWFKSWMVSRAGKRSGTVYVVIKDRMHRKFRVAFMNVNWESDGTNFANYNYEFVY